MWTLSVQRAVPGPELIAAIDALEFEGETAAHVIEQIDAAKAAAKQLFESGAVGATDDDSVRYHVSLGGHANPDHVPTAGYENDTLVVHVFQAAQVVPVDQPDQPAPAEEGSASEAPAGENAPPQPGSELDDKASQPDKGTPPADEGGAKESAAVPPPVTPPVAGSGEGVS